MSNSATIIAPYGGINERLPKAALQSPYCERLVNFNVSQAGISLRNGDKLTSKSTRPANSTAFTLAPYGTSFLWIISNNLVSGKIDIIDSENNTVTYSSAASGIDSWSISYFNKYLYAFGYSNFVPGFVYDGSTWAVTGYTGTGFSPINGAAFNQRHYMVQKNEAAYWYSGIDSVTGAVTKVDLSSLVEYKTSLMIIAPITIADNITAQTFLAFVFMDGQVLFYEGSYPDSDSWRRVGKAKIGQPVSYSGSIKYQGDTLILCDTGVVSLRDLFLKGSEAAASLTVNANIKKSWTDLIKLVRSTYSIPTGELTSFFSGVWDQKNDRIIIGSSVYLNDSGGLEFGAGFFVFDCQLQSWYLHRSYDSLASNDPDRVLNAMAFYKNKVFYLGYDSAWYPVIEKEGAANYTDRNGADDTDVPYTYKMLSAPIPFPKTAAYEATTIEPIIESDLYAQTNWNLVADFGRQTSGDQKTDALTTAVAKPAVNVGMQNITYVQVKMSGTTTTGKTVGLDLYSYNVWYNAGETGSR